MTTFKTLLACAALTAALGTPVIAQSHDHHSAPQAAAAEPASTRDFKEVHAKMMRDMGQAYTGNPDLDFVRGMIPHHQGAIDMARVLLKHGKDPEIRKLAEQVIADQEREIVQMRDWVKKNGG